MKSRQSSNWQRRLAVWFRRRRWIPFVEIATTVALVATAAATYFIVVRAAPGQKLLGPPLIALLLVANLVPAIALLVFFGRRVAKSRATRSAVGGGGRLHVRLVGIFSLVASIPMLLVVIFASLLFQYGVEFWFSEKARSMFDNATVIAQQSYNEKLSRVALQTTTMAGDLASAARSVRIEDPRFAAYFVEQIRYRELSETAIVRITPGGVFQTLAAVNPEDRPVESRITSGAIARLRAGERVIVTDTGDRIEAVTTLAIAPDTYLYSSSVSNPEMLAQTQRAAAVTKDYQSLLSRSRRVQLQFNAALLVISLLIIGATVWIALNVADRLVRPVGELVGAARRVAGGDLSARVASPRTNDEVGTLATAFNRMTRRLEEQTGALDSRRALIEAVLSGVSAGVISVNADRVILLLNSSAQMLLGAEGNPIGQPLKLLAPELETVLDGGEREAITQITSGTEPKTLAVKVVTDERGQVLTFDDITQQLLDQRRAAWSDVARRIAHEIKNPLTPIQLAAERLKRRYTKEITSDPATFEKLTDTIVRQVGDLRRMVDEFSSFARMPKPVFREEGLVDIARQVLFLHEVAHPTIAFTLDAPDPAIAMVCDRRQLGQALTNIVKNAVEAIDQSEAATGSVRLTLATTTQKHIDITVSDTGIGLPVERDRLVEPYMTTRTRGTGLGLAIVKKIVEEHFGTMSFSDADGGGATVRLHFDPALLAPLVLASETADANDPIPTELSRTGRG